jgi:hypothetical protein
MKIRGILLLLAGMGWAYMWRNDPVDSAYMCPVGITAAAAGFFMFFEGLKREIIAAVGPKDEMDRR